MGMVPSFSTQRLAVRDWREVARDRAAWAELQAALEVILTEPVLRYLPTDLQHSGPGFDKRAWWATLTARNVVGVVTPAAPDDPMGFLTLREERLAQCAPHMWIGYLFAEQAWGRGYATELVRGAIEALRGPSDLQLRAGVAMDNAASMHVLRKAGFVADPESSGDDLTVFTFPKP
jgi:ribosomal-protein-alanine N-acetyltransferase